MNQEEMMQDLHKRTMALELGGGIEKQKKQQLLGKNLARRRIELLLDEGSFMEHQRFATGPDKQPGDGVITGFGTIEKRIVCIYAQDFTVSGGALGKVHAKKICAIMDLAFEIGAPIIGLIDSGGARIQEGIDALNGYGEIFKRNVRYSGVVPQLSVMLGPCAGGAVYSPALTDAVFMVAKMSQLFITGPKVLKMACGEEATVEQLGGYQLHSTKSGVVQFVADSEMKVFEQVTEFLSYLPDKQEKKACTIEKPKLSEFKLPENEKEVYNVKKIIESIADNGEMLEVSKTFARNLVTGFIRLNGMSVGVVANNPAHLAGCIDIDASDKCARFVRYCDCYEIPLLMLEDVSGFIPGMDQESRGLIRHGAKIIYAFAEATVPKITLILRKAYGGAYVALNSKALGADFVFAWPTAEISVMGPNGAAVIVNQNSSPEATESFIDHYKRHHVSPFNATEKGLVDDIFNPIETREKLIMSFSLLNCKQTETERKRRHGNIPL